SDPVKVCYLLVSGTGEAERLVSIQNVSGLAQGLADGSAGCCASAASGHAAAPGVCYGHLLDGDSRRTPSNLLRHRKHRCNFKKVKLALKPDGERCES